MWNDYSKLLPIQSISTKVIFLCLFSLALRKCDSGLGTKKILLAVGNFNSEDKEKKKLRKYSDVGWQELSLKSCSNF